MDFSPHQPNHVLSLLSAYSRYPTSRNFFQMEDMILEKPVVIFSKSSCCMSHSIKTLLSELGANPTVHELDEIPRGKEIEQALVRRGCSPAVPAVFIGGQLVGGASEVMRLHLNGSLIPMLKGAGQ